MTAHGIEVSDEIIAACVGRMKTLGVGVCQASCRLSVAFMLLF